VEIRQLEHFVAAAEEGHFSRAAERSNIVQSGLSASIRGLERELGTRLFDRTTRRVSLTESGRALLPEARRVLAAATGAREAVAGVEGLMRGTLSIGVMQSLVAVRLPALLARFRSHHPGVDIRLRQAGTTILLQEVREGGLELAFAWLPDPAPPGLAAHELLRETMMLACSPEHPLAGRTTVSLAGLRDEPFVDGYPVWGIRMANDRAFREAGIERHVAFEVNDMPTMLDLVAHNLGVAVLPRSLAPLRTPLRFVRVRGKAPRWNVTLVAPEHMELSAASRAFFEMVVGEDRRYPSRADPE
jgi:DNA-binding transcriptional LysR family regulator